MNEVTFPIGSDRIPYLQKYNVSFKVFEDNDPANVWITMYATGTNVMNFGFAMARYGLEDGFKSIEDGVKEITNHVPG